MLPTLRAVTAPGCRSVRVELVEVGEQGWVEYVISGYPGPFLWAVTLPVDQIFKADPSTPGVQDGIDPLEDVLSSDLGRRR